MFFNATYSQVKLAKMVSALLWGRQPCPRWSNQGWHQCFGDANSLTGLWAGSDATSWTGCGRVITQSWERFRFPTLWASSDATLRTSHGLVITQPCKRVMLTTLWVDYDATLGTGYVPILWTGYDAIFSVIFTSFADRFGRLVCHLLG